MQTRLAHYISKLFDKQLLLDDFKLSRAHSPVVLRLTSLIVSSMEYLRTTYYPHDFLITHKETHYRFLINICSKRAIDITTTDSDDHGSRV